jgi:hypothetical protein
MHAELSTEVFKKAEAIEYRYFSSNVNDTRRN